MNTTKVIIAIISLLGFVQARPSYRKNYLRRRPKADYSGVQPDISQCFELYDRRQKITCLNQARKRAKLINAALASPVVGNYRPLPGNTIWKY